MEDRQSCLSVPGDRSTEDRQDCLSSTFARATIRARLRPPERIIFLVLAAVSLALRALAFTRYRFDSDEPQHLHVTWGWTAGLVQYRDVFDNHAPLFHMITAPILASLGERPDILLYMRAPMLVLFAVVIACTYAAGRALYSPRVGAWAALMLSLFPPFFLKSLEYRSDNLWNALWMAAFALMLSAHQNVIRGFVIGLLLGSALAASIKTTLLVISIAAALLIVRSVRIRLLAAIAGAAVIPGLIVLYFASLGALRELVFGVVGFNSVLAESRTLAWAGRIVYPFAILGIYLIARRYRDSEPRRLFAAVVFAVYVVTLVALWLLISPRDLLPMMPLAAVFFAGVVDGMETRARVHAIAAAVCAIALLYYADAFERRTDEHITMMDQVLRLTRPGEMLMDIKGETIFRRRPFYYAFEVITREQMRRGIIRDTIPERVVETRTYVAQADGPMLPERGRTFLAANFLDMGRLRAAGRWIAPDGTFTIAIPGPYVIVNESGLASGFLDGRRYSGARELNAGPHAFDRAVPGERVAVVWARAFERGHSPFHLRDRDF